MMRHGECRARTRVCNPVPHPRSSMRLWGPSPVTSASAFSVLASSPGPCLGSPSKISKEMRVARSSDIFSTFCVHLPSPNPIPRFRFVCLVRAPKAEGPTLPGAYNRAAKAVMIRRLHRPLFIALLSSFCAFTVAASARMAPAADAAAAADSWTGDLSPIAASYWNYERAAHLIERAGFGATPEEIARVAAMTPERAVSTLVDYETIDASALKPFDESGIWDPGMDPFPPSRAEAVRRAREHGEGLGEKVLPPGTQRRLQPVVDKFFYSLTANNIETQRLGLWWANRMLASPRPLEEKLTLFWHGHFATGQNKVRDYRMMFQQNRMLRANASGNLRELLVGILKDPGMLVYLDNGENVKSHPNENFGRELLELFTMGVGNYSERDVREAARAFTGWTNDVLTYKFDAEQHDFGQKTFLGRTGPLNGEDIIDTILAQPVTGEYVAGKLYRYFVREEISSDVRADLGRSFRASRYQIKPLMRRMLLSKDFYSAPSVATQIKSPVHLVVSTYKKMGLREVPTI